MGENIQAQQYLPPFRQWNSPLCCMVRPDVDIGLPEHAIKFLSRGSNSSTRFKIDPFPVSDEEDEPQDDNYVTYVFHPVYPFAISCICNHLSPTPLIMKFYYR